MNRIAAAIFVTFPVPKCKIIALIFNIWREPDYFSFQVWPCWFLWEKNMMAPLGEKKQSSFLRRQFQCRCHSEWSHLLWMYGCMFFKITNIVFSDFKWSAMAERFSALDLCSDGWVVRMWVRSPTATVVLMSLSKTLYHNWGQSWLLCLISPMRRNGSNWAVYSPGSWDGFRNHLCVWWTGVIMLSAVIPRVRAL